MKKQLKQFLTKENIEKIIESTQNEKHIFILTLLYKLQLTTGMIINLKIKDIRDNIMYCRGKRIYISDSLMHDFYTFTNCKSQNEYLVKSQSGKKYSIRTIQEIRKKALKFAKLL